MSKDNVELMVDYIKDNFNGCYEMWIGPVAIYDALHPAKAEVELTLSSKPTNAMIIADYIKCMEITGLKGSGKWLSSYFDKAEVDSTEAEVKRIIEEFSNVCYYLGYHDGYDKLSQSPKGLELERNDAHSQLKEVISVMQATRNNSKLVKEIEAARQRMQRQEWFYKDDITLLDKCKAVLKNQDKQG